MESLTIGQNINLINAKVIKAEMDYDLYNRFRRSNMRITVEDETYGRIWFQTAAEFAYSLCDNDMLSCSLKVSAIKPDIIFGKNPTKHYIAKNNNK